ncbi:bile acid:sodium symporter [Desulfomarina sp.]
MDLLKKYSFLMGLILVAVFTLADTRGITTGAGLWLKEHRGPDCIIVLIFFLSGLALDTSTIRAGLSDIKGTLAALLLIFIIAPLLTLPFSFFQPDPAILIGLFLVAVMPTTLSSGVVMTGSSGGNMAHALLITIIANSLAVITIPLTLSLLLAMTGDSRTVEIDQLPIIIKIGSLVLLPLAGGIILRRKQQAITRPFLPYTVTCSQIGILAMIWMALCRGRETILANLDAVYPVLTIIFLFHLALIVTGLLLARILGIGQGRRESVIFMGVQKTLPLSIILQVSLFPEFSLALVVCVLHHVIHLIMDGFLVEYLKGKK